MLRLLESLKCEFIDTKPLYVEVFNIEENDAINVHYESSGYETSDFILNIGTALILILASPIFAIVTIMLSKCC